MMMMEQIDMDQVRSYQGRERSKFLTLRKYSLAICFFEAFLILLMIYAYLFLLNTQNNTTTSSSSATQLSYPQNEQYDTLTKINYQTYSNGVNSTKLLLSLVGNCNQRKHDYPYGVGCKSSSIKSTCIPLDGQVDVEELEKSSTFLSSDATLATIVTTSRSGLRFQTRRRVHLKEVQCSQQQNDIKDACRFKTKLHVYVNEKQQKIIGWGGALTDSSINNILSLTTNGTERLLDDYFGQDGLKFNLIRITIGGSDFSSRFYTNDDIDKKKTSDDFELEQFRLRAEDVLYKIPALQFIQKRYKQNDLKLFASMWSPPTWMKTNEHFNKGKMKGSISLTKEFFENDERYFKSLAMLKKNFILAYQAQSINFWGLTVMNEPVFAVQPFLNFNTMIFPSSDYAAYVAKYLGPMIRQDERLKHLKLIIHDDNRRYLKMFTTELLQEPKVSQYIDGISVHGYIDEDYGMMDEMVEFAKNNSKGMLDEKKNFFILPTELCSGHLPFMEKAMVGNWHRGVHYALDIIHNLQHSAAGWVDWNMALDIEGGPGWLGGRLDSAIIVDKQADAYYKNPMFYALGHFSRYIPPGSTKLKSQIFNDQYDYQFETVTFSLPQENFLVTVVVNHNPYEVELNIKVLEGTDVGISNTYHSVTCSADSVTTIIYPRKI